MLINLREYIFFRYECCVFLYPIWKRCTKPTRFKNEKMRLYYAFYMKAFHFHVVEIVHEFIKGNVVFFLSREDRKAQILRTMKFVAVYRIYSLLEIIQLKRLWTSSSSIGNDWIYPEGPSISGMEPIFLFQNLFSGHDEYDEYISNLPFVWIIRVRVMK